MNFTVDISVVKSRAEGSPLLQDNREQGHVGLRLGLGQGHLQTRDVVKSCGEKIKLAPSLSYILIGKIGNITIL